MFFKISQGEYVEDYIEMEESEHLSEGPPPLPEKSPLANMNASVYPQKRQDLASTLDRQSICA